MDLLKKIARMVEYHKPKSDEDKIMCSYVDDLVDVVNGLGAKPFDRWTPVSSRKKPAHLEDVLIYLGDGLVEVARFNNGSYETLSSLDITSMVLSWRKMVATPV